MKRLVMLAGLLIATTLGGNAEDNIVGMQMVRHGTNVTERPSASLTTNVIRLLQSCSVSSTAYAVKSDTWGDLLRSDSFIHLSFAAPRKLEVMLNTSLDAARQPQKESIDEILVPLPEGKSSYGPLHIFAKSGTKVLSFTKYDPTALIVVAFEPALHLSSVYPYSKLARILQSAK
jgi:hypothetical protein